MKIKRTICLILAMLMVFACLPAIAFAGNVEAVIRSVSYNGKSYIPSGREITLDVPASSAAVNLQKELEIIYDDSKGYKYYAPLFPDGAGLEAGKSVRIRAQYEHNGILYESDYTVKLNKLPFAASAFTGNISRLIVISAGDDRPGKKIFQDCYIKNDGAAFGGIVINGVDPNIAVFKLAGKELDSAAAVKLAAEDLDNLYISPRNPGKMSVLLKAYAADGKDVPGHASLDIQIIKTGILETLRANLDQYGALAASYFGLDAAFSDAVGQKPASIKIVSAPKYGNFIYDYKSDADCGKNLASGVAISAEEFATLCYVPVRAAIVSDVTELISYEAFDAAGNKYAGTLEIGIKYKKPDSTELNMQVELNTPYAFKELDFTSAFKALSNDELSYVKFAKPDPALGSIRENYIDETLRGTEIDEATKYYNSSSITKRISDLIFVPAKGYKGSFYILYSAYSAASENAYSGRIRVDVRDTEIPAIDCELMQDEFLRFDRIYQLIDEQFRKHAESSEGYSYLKFEAPTSTQGEFYYNYNAELMKGEAVTSTDRYYRTDANLKLVKDIYFVPSRNTSGNFALRYSCFAANGDKYKGTLNVTLNKASYDIKTLTYTLKQGEIFKFRVSDLSEELSKFSSSTKFSYIYINELPAKSSGTLYASYSEGKPGAELLAGDGDKYYREGSGVRLASDISFVPAKDFSGIVKLEYSASVSDEVKYIGKIVLDIKDSGGVLPEIKYSADTGGIVKLKSADFVAALGQLTNNKLSEIRLELPSENNGTFYIGYKSSASYDSKLESKTSLYISGENRKLIDDVSLVAASAYEGGFSINYTAIDELSREYSGKLTFEVSYKSSFIDVKETDYFALPVKWAVEKKITAGISKEKFGPEIVCTRAQMVTLLWNAAGSPQPKSVNPFKDVKFDDYYFNAVRWAYNEGITSGTSADSFSPDKEVTRAQVMTMLYSYHDKPAVSIVNPFKDVAANQYYYKPVLWAYQAGVTKGTGSGRFSPNDGCTRAQIVTFLYNDMKE